MSKAILRIEILSRRTFAGSVSLVASEIESCRVQFQSRHVVYPNTRIEVRIVTVTITMSYHHCHHHPQALYVLYMNRSVVILHSASVHIISSSAITEPHGSYSIPLFAPDHHCSDLPRAA